MTVSSTKRSGIMLDFPSYLTVVRERARLVHSKTQQGKSAYKQEWQALADEFKKMLDEPNGARNSNTPLAKFLDILFEHVYPGDLHYRNMGLAPRLHEVHFKVWLPLWAKAHYVDCPRVEGTAMSLPGRIADACHEYLTPQKLLTAPRGKLIIHQGGKQ